MGPSSRTQIISASISAKERSRRVTLPFLYHANDAKVLCAMPGPAPPLLYTVSVIQWHVQTFPKGCEDLASYPRIA